MRPKRIRKKEDRYISTREAARMLGIAMSTVYRYFDWGILTGEQHPITHLRRIDKGSVIALMKNYGMKWEEQP
jgi:DNA invertase Pin-like site-specific DNA recombinase